MGLADLLSDLYDSIAWPEAHAEAKEEDDQEEESQDDSKEGGDGGEDESNDSDEGGDNEGSDNEEGGEEKEEEEEEEEDEPEDPKPKLEEECANSAQCSGAKHHFDACVERVTAQQESDEEKKGPHEDCVEELCSAQAVADAEVSCCICGKVKQ